MSESKEQKPLEIPKVVQGEFSRGMSDVKDARFESDKLFSVRKNGPLVFREYDSYFYENGSQWPVFKLRARLESGEEGIDGIALFEEGRRDASLGVAFPNKFNRERTSVRLDRGSGELYVEYRDGHLVHASFEPHKPADIDEEPQLDPAMGNWIYKPGDESSYDEGQAYSEESSQMIKTKRDGNLIRAERVVNDEVVDLFVMPEQIDVESIKSELFPRSLREDVFGASTEEDEKWTQSTEVLGAMGVDWQIQGDEDSERTQKMKEYWDKLMKDIDNHDDED